MSDTIEDRYAEIFGDGSLCYAACFSWVRDLPPEQALQRLGVRGPLRNRTVGEIDRLLAGLDGAKDADGAWLEPVGAVAGSLGDWTLVVEPNGFAATVAGDLAALSAGTEAVSVFWNVNGLAELAVARDGEPVSVLHDLIFFVDPDGNGAQATQDDVQGSDPALVRDLVAELAGERSYKWKPIVLAWVERHTGAPMPRGWLDAPHPGGASGKRRGSRSTS